MLTLDDIRRALATVAPAIRDTPILSSGALVRRLQAGGLAASADRALVRMKAEHLQRTGSFKIRGAYNRIAQLTPDERRRGVLAVSAGNHAQGVALAAASLGIPATIFMPETASIAKIDATEGYGATVVLAGRSFDEAAAACDIREAETQAVFISPYDDDDIIAGQGTLGLELLAQVPDVDTVLVPIGGGGLFAGVATALKESRPGIRVVGVQAEGADTAARSFRAGKLIPRAEPVRTICDGIAIKAPSPRTFAYLAKYADDVVTVSDSEVADAMLLLLERCKAVVEPSGAAGVAALLAGKVPVRGVTATILCGGNIDALRLAEIAQREMVRAGRYLHLRTAADDHPGGLVQLLRIVADQRGNVVTVTHNRLSLRAPLGMSEIELLVEVRDSDHAAAIVAALQEYGLPAEVLG
jgi:threonine dehydratase